jgi:hypothetical protein
MLSPQAEALARLLLVVVGLPIIGWLCAVIGERAKTESLKRNGNRPDQYRLFWTVRLIFVAGAVTLLGLALVSLSTQPTDYLAICLGISIALLVYPVWANFSRLGFTWGALGTAAQVVSLGLVAGSVWFGLPVLSQSQVPTVDVLRSYVSLLTWPVVTVVGGIVFFPYVARILENVDSLEGFGGKISLRRRQEIEDVVEASIQDDVASELTASSMGATVAADEIGDLPRRVRRADAKYSNVIKAWSILSRLIANIARAAGHPNINISKSGLRELAARGVLQEGLAAEALALFAERNSFRSREAPISATEHGRYLTRAQELAVKLAALLPTAEAPSGASQTGATRH